MQPAMLYCFCLGPYEEFLTDFQITFYYSMTLDFKTKKKKGTSREKDATVTIGK